MQDEKEITVLKMKKAAVNLYPSSFKKRDLDQNYSKIERKDNFYFIVIFLLHLFEKQYRRSITFLSTNGEARNEGYAIYPMFRERC